ncbi:MAG: ATP-grasp domain-containing protein [Desulfomonilia bacterium]
MNILLSSVGRRSYLVRYFQQALGGRGLVIATNSHTHATGMLAADRAAVVPPAGSEDFIEQLLDVCRHYEVGLLCSLHDWESPFIARACNRFRQLGTKVAVSDPSVLDTCLDKYAFWEFGMREGIRVPKTALGLDSALQYIADGTLDFPLVVKPRYGQGSIAVETVFTEDELHSSFLLAKGKISRMESNGLLRSSLEDLIVQEYVQGQEYGLDVVNDLNGKFAACFVKRKLAMRSGETDAAETVADPVLESFGRFIGERLIHTGMLDVDVIVGRNGPCLLEANPRFGGHYPFSHEAGADIPAALIAWAQDRDPDPAWLRVRAGVQCLKDMRLVSRS